MKILTFGTILECKMGYGHYVVRDVFPATQMMCYEVMNVKTNSVDYLNAEEIHNAYTICDGQEEIGRILFCEKDK